MAAKVNKQVVVGLVVGVVCLVAAVVFLMTFVFKSGADLAAKGDALMAEGKFDEAAQVYSKAVNKEQNNIEYYRKWSKALATQTPTSLQAYSDRFNQWYGTQRRIADVLRVDPAAHAAVLDMQLRSARMSSKAGPAWQQLESEASDIIARMSKEPQEKIDRIRRYRGIATTGKLGQALDVSADDRKRAKEDLIAALKVLPDDPLVIAYYADLMRISADKAFQSNNPEEGSAILAEALAVANDYCEKHPKSAVSRLGLIEIEGADLMARSRANPALADELAKSLKPNVEKLLSTLESDDPATVDELFVVNILDLAVRNKIDNATERGIAFYDKLLAAHPDEPYSKLMRARFLSTTGNPRVAADAFKQIAELPNLPISQAGITLFNVRDQAMALRVDALMALTEQAKTPEDKAKALAEAKAARDEVKAKPTIDESVKVLIDAKIALLSNDSPEARKLLGRYNQLTGYGDPSALVLLSHVLYTQNLKSEARSLLTRVVDMRAANLDVYKFLVQIDAEMRNANSALNWVEQGLALSPGDEQLLTMRKSLQNFAAPQESDNPYIRALGLVQAALTQTPPDKALALAKSEDALKLCNKPEDYAGLARTIAMASREAALKVTEKGLTKFADNDILKRLNTAYKIDNPYEYTLKEIDNNKDLTPAQKAVQRYLLASNYEKYEDALKALNEAAAQDPENPIVVAGQFEKTLSDYQRTKDPKTLEAARALTQKAVDKNLDKVDGRIYKARMLQTEGRSNEALPLLERASELDTLNPLTWRYLSNLYIEIGDMGKALQAIERSLQIKSDDITSIVSRMRVLTAMDRIPEALSAAREASKLGISNPVFVHLWLILEFRAGDKDLALARRAWIFKNEPDNTENSLAHARDLLQVKRVDDAQQVIAAIDGKPNTEPTLTMLKAAVKGARGDTAGALEGFDKLIASLEKNERITKDNLAQAQENASVEFAELINTLGNVDLVVQVLNNARKYQTGERARVDRMLGDVQFSRANWAEARKAYSQARETSKDDTDKLLLKRIIECYMRAKDFAEARKLIDAEGGDKSTDLQILLLASQLEISRGDRAKGLQLLDKAVDAAPQNPLPYRQRGIEKMNDSRTLDDAVVDFMQASGMDPRNPDLIVLLSRAQVKQGQPLVALSTIEKALTIQPENATLRNEQVQLLTSMNRQQDAVKALEDARKADPNNIQWQLLRGVMFQRMGDQASAVIVYEEAWSNFKSPAIGKALADSLMAQYDAGANKNPPVKDVALLARTKAVTDAPEFGVATEPMCRLTRATLELRQGNTEAANADLAAVFEKLGPAAGDTTNAAFIIDDLRRVYAGDMNKVLALLEKARPAAGWPEGFRLTAARGMMSERNDKALRAKGYLELDNLMKSQTLAIAIGAASTYGGNAFLDGNFEEAVRVFQEGLKLDPDNIELNNNLAYVLSRGLKRHAEALPRARKAAEKDPNNPNILDTLGVIQMETSDLDGAETTLQRARSIAPDGVSRTMPVLHLIELRLKKNDRAEADKLMRELDDLLANEPRVKATYGRDIEEIKKTMKPNP